MQQRAMRWICLPASNGRSKSYRPTSGVAQAERCPGTSPEKRFATRRAGYLVTGTIMAEMGENGNG